MKKIALFVIALLMYAGCEGPQNLPTTPPHLNRVPTVVGIQADKDTLASGKVRVFISWAASNNTNLKGFEVFKSTNVLSKFKSEKQTSSFNFLDTFAVAATDTIAYYYVSTIGNDLFIGKNSDTILVNIKK